VLQGNAEVEDATLKCRSTRRYSVMQKQQALHGNAGVAVVTL
jgi:hypothetical protein